jgi:hypothetical protein
MTGLAAQPAVVIPVIRLQSSIVHCDGVGQIETAAAAIYQGAADEL